MLGMYSFMPQRGDYAYDREFLKRVKISDSVRIIAEFAFKRNSGLSQVVF